MGNGTSSYFGYEYQFYVSVWLMLLAHKKPDSEFAQIDIETLFGQDIEIVLGKATSDDVALDNYEESLSIRQRIGEYSVQVQVKTRGMERQWFPGDIRNVLLKADESQPRHKALTVLERLAEFPNESFVFITNGRASGPLLSLHRDIEGAIADDEYRKEHSDDECFSVREYLIRGETDDNRKGLLQAHLSPDVIRRILIFDALSFDDLRRKIEMILEREYRILPYTRARTTVQQLAERVRASALGERGAISAKELTGIIGNRLPQLPFPEVDAVFHKPDGYSVASSRLSEKHLVILSGEPGVGKTTIAQKLVNDLFNQGYDYEYVSQNQYSEVLRACRRRKAIVLFGDDPFGAISFDGQVALGNVFNDLTSQLSAVDGKVKLILATRRNILSEFIEKSRVTRHTLNEYRVSVETSDPEFEQAVLGAHLDFFQFTDEQKSQLSSALEWTPTLFENLLHIRSFVSEIHRNPTALDALTAPLQSTRPSEYERWIAEQPPRVQLFLLVLYLMTDATQVVEEEGIQRVYRTLAKVPGCIETLDYDNSGFNFYSALDSLRTQGQILTNTKNGYEFIHPQLKAAVAAFFEEHSGFVELFSSIVDRLNKVPHPMEQSIAAMVATIYYDQLEISLKLLKEICQSKFLQVRDTVISFGVSLLGHEDDELKQWMDKFYSLRYRPGENCELSADGHLLVTPSESEFVYVTSLSDALDRWLAEKTSQRGYFHYFDENRPSRASVRELNPVEKYWLVHWLTHPDTSLTNADLSYFLGELAVDHTSFVRYTVAAQLGERDLTEIEELWTVFKTLAYDSSPHVKIDLLENAIMPNWAELPEGRQQEVFEYVLDMLDDPIFRRRVARGLIDQSGTLYFYHQDHTPEQKRRWFEAVALKLLEHDFRNAYGLDRFLAAFETHTESLDGSFRESVLRCTKDYVDRNPLQAIAVTDTIRKLTLASSTTSLERSILLDLMRGLPVDAKADLLFDFAKEYNDLPDERYQDFVLRPFYTEDADEFVIERSAALLGFLDCSDIDSVSLPEPISVLAEDIQGALHQYLNVQTADFKLITICQVFGHGWFAQTAASSGGLHSHPVVEELIHYLLSDEAGTQTNILVADVLLRSGYMRTGAYSVPETAKLDRAKWDEYVDIIFTSQDRDVTKAACDIVFAANIESAVHNYTDWLTILYRFVTHPSDDLKDYAIELFNQHFHQIWQDLLRYGEAEILELWFDSDASQKLRERSDLFDLALDLLACLQGWEKLSEHQRQKNLDSLCEIAAVPNYQLKWLVFHFVKQIGDRIPESESERLYRVIFGSSSDRRAINIPGRKEQLALDGSLGERLPALDIHKYLN